MKIKTDLPVLFVALAFTASIASSFAAFIEAQGTNRPLLVELDHGWMEMQKDLATLSTNSEHIISADATHNMVRDKPNLVVHGIRLLIERINR